MSALEKYRVDVPVPSGEAAPDVFSICFERAPKNATPEQKRVDILAQKDRAVAFPKALIDARGKAARRAGLVIIGGGVAGVVAALAAVQEGIGVTLLEEKPERFSRQANSEKFIYPNLYSWPKLGWENPEFIPPVGQENLFFRWRNDRANEVAKMWDAQTLHINGHIDGSLRLKWDEIGKPTVDKNRKKLSEMFHNLDPNLIGGRPLLFALGFYQDKCWINEKADEDKENARDLALHEGPIYWGKCDYPDEKCTSIVITGGGDGGLQDFITISTRLEVHELAEALLSDPQVKKKIDDSWRKAFAKLKDPRDCHDEIGKIIAGFPATGWDQFLKQKTNGQSPSTCCCPSQSLGIAFHSTPCSPG